MNPTSVFDLIIRKIDKNIENIRNVVLRRVVGTLFLLLVIAFALSYCALKYKTRQEMWGL